jgi:hypothetical protein
MEVACGALTQMGLLDAILLVADREDARLYYHSVRPGRDLGRSSKLVA